MAKAPLDATFNCHEKRQIVESKARAKRISLTNDTYEDTIYHQPLFHRAGLHRLGPKPGHRVSSFFESSRVRFTKPHRRKRMGAENG